LVFLDYGSEIFKRSKYIPKDYSYFKTIYQFSFLIISVISGVIYKKHKAVAIFSIIISILFSLSIGSRNATVYLAAFGITYSVFLNYNERKRFYLVFIPFVFVFFGYNISLRSEASGHGLIPYFNVTIKKPEIILKYAIENLYYTISFGFFATADTITEYKNATINNLITCLSPLPGFMTRWYLIAKNMRSNIFSPFTSIGELAKFPVFSIFYYFFVGFYFASIDFFIKKEILLKKYFFAVVQFLLLSLFVISSFEYNLRASNRFLYYSLFFYLIYFVYKLSFKNAGTKQK
jgi:hypothetical protein